MQHIVGRAFICYTNSIGVLWTCSSMSVALLHAIHSLSCRGQISSPVQCTVNLHYIYTAFLTCNLAHCGCSWSTQLDQAVQTTSSMHIHMLVVAHCKCNIKAVSIIRMWRHLRNWTMLSKIEAVQWIRMRGHLQNDVRYIYTYLHINIGGRCLTSMGRAQAHPNKRVN